MKSISNLHLLAIFAIPSIIMFAFFHLGIPFMVNIGFSPFVAFILAHLIPLALLFFASLLAFRRENLAWSQFGERFRFPRFTWQSILWAIGLFVLLNIGYGFMSAISVNLIKEGFIFLPNELPALIDPRNAVTISALDTMAGGSIKGNWGIVALYFVMLFFNIAGEELWWRGYILPRQELKHGRWTWLIHGLLWTAFHTFKWWDLLNLLPVCLLISYAAQKSKNNWIPFIAHYLFNGLGFILVLLAALGLL